MTGSRRRATVSVSRFSRGLGFTRIVFACCLALLCIRCLTGSAQAPASGPDCALAKGTYTCNVESLKAAVAAAKTFAVKASPRDRIGASQVQTLGASLGKSLALANQPADLTFVLASTETGGVNYGQMDRDLATLKVYAGEARSPIWVETLSGQPDLPWGAVVHRLIERFQARLKH